VGKRIKFNVHDIFMDSQNTVSDRNIFVSSPLFGVFAAAYNRSEGKVKVGQLRMKTESNNVRYVGSVPVVSRLGMSVGSIDNYSGDSYSSVAFATHANPFDGYAVSKRVRSGNVKYIQSKLSRGSTHDIANSFDAALDRSEKAIGVNLRQMILNSIEVESGDDGAPVFDIRNGGDDHLITFLARYFAGEVERAELKPSFQQEFDKLFKKYTDQRNKFKAALKSAYDMVSTEKWFYVTNINGGVLLGGISSLPMCAALDAFVRDNELPWVSELNYVKETVPFKWYLSHEHIPDELRQQLDFSIAMLKAHRNTAEALPKGGRGFFHDLGCWYDTQSASLYVLTK